MTTPKRLLVAAIVVAGGVGVYFIIDHWPRTIDRTKRSGVYGEMVDTYRDPIVHVEFCADVRGRERNRRAQRPVGEKHESYAIGYDSVFKGHDQDGIPQRAKPAESMPPTACRSVEPAPKHVDNRSGPHQVHDLAVSDFETSSGFGAVRMEIFENRRGVRVASQAIDRVELVSLLTEAEPSVYVLDEMATPPLTRQAKRRPLDEFEKLALDSVRRGEQLVWTREAPTRMFGAIRARRHCLECHTNANKGDLLGALTYYLDVPVNELSAKPD
jgi:hypothetical protein